MAGWDTAVTGGAHVREEGWAVPSQGHRAVSLAFPELILNGGIEGRLGRLTQVNSRRRRTGYGNPRQ